MMTLLYKINMFTPLNFKLRYSCTLHISLSCSGMSFDPMGQGNKGPAPPLEQKPEDS